MSDMQQSNPQNPSRREAHLGLHPQHLPPLFSHGTRLERRGARLGRGEVERGVGEAVAEGVERRVALVQVARDVLLRPVGGGARQVRLARRASGVEVVVVEGDLPQAPGEGDGQPGAEVHVAL